MTFRVSLLIDADGKAAIVGINRVGDAMRKARGETEKLGTTSEATTAKTDRLSTAQKTAAQTSLALAQSQRIAAGSVGNLAAQFNDIGVMLASGQNPLQLALQQGTQISQVLGPMGAKGAVSALGGAFMGMLSPVSLITIGSIAAGAAMFQWLTGAGEAAATADDALDKMGESANAYTEALSRSRMTTAQLREEYGAMAEDARANLAVLAEDERRRAQRQAAEVSASITGGYGSYRQGHQQTNIADLFDLNLSGTGRELGREFVLPVIQAFEEVDAAANGSLQQQLASLERLTLAFRAAAEARGGVSSSEDETIGQLEEQLRILREINLEESRNLPRSPAQWADLAAAGRNEERVVLMREVLQLEEAAARASERKAATDTVTAQQMIAAMAERSNMAALIAQYGAESAQVAEAEAAAARDVVAAQAEALDVSARQKAQLMAAYDVMVLMEQTNVAGTLAAGADQAGRMAGNLSTALAFAQQIAMVQAATPAAPAELGFGLGAAPNGGTGVELGFGNMRGSNFTTPPTNFGGGGVGSPSGGGGAVREERDAVAELIKRLQEEADIRAELDPVQQDMLRYREELAGATAAQRAEVEALIAAEQREADAAQATQERWQHLRQTAYDALLIMAKGGDDASDALRNLAASLAEAAFQAAIMGEGPLGSLFGGTSIFGLIGGALGLGGGAAGGGSGGAGGGIGRLAKGGYLTGPGDGTSDSILMYGSSGEMMMNARAVRKNRHLLEAMNANAPIRGYAKGGLVGGSGAGRDLMVGNSAPVQITIDVSGARGNAEIMDMVWAGVEQGMAQYDRVILPSSVQRISADSRRIG